MVTGQYRAHRTWRGEECKAKFCWQNGRGLSLLGVVIYKLQQCMLSLSTDSSEYNVILATGLLEGGAAPPAPFFATPLWSYFCKKWTSEKVNENHSTFHTESVTRAPNSVPLFTSSKRILTFTYSFTWRACNRKTAPKTSLW